MLSLLRLVSFLCLLATASMCLAQTAVAPGDIVDESLPSLQGEEPSSPSTETKPAETPAAENADTAEEEAAPVGESAVPSDSETLVETPAPASADPTPAVPVSTPVESSVAPAAQTPTSETSRPLSIGRIAAWALLAVFLALMAFWGVIVAGSFLRKQKFLDAGQDDSPSSDERLLSELTTLQVSLLRGEAVSYYEKALSLLRQLLKSRKLLDSLQVDGAKVVESLKSAGVDPTYMDSVESIVHRCEAVLFHGERPDAAAHAKLEKDLRTLVRMRPHGSHFGGRKEKESVKE